MKRIKNRLKPKYAVVGFWIFWALFLPLNSFGQFAILVILSLMINKWAKKKWPAWADEQFGQNNQQYNQQFNQQNNQQFNPQNGRPMGSRVEGQGGLQSRVYRTDDFVDVVVKPAPPEPDIRLKKAENQNSGDAMYAQKAQEPGAAGTQNKRRQRTGDPNIDKMLDEEEKAISELKRLNNAIPDEKLSAQIDHLEDVTTKIVNFIVEHPDKKSEVSRFFNYYLPTTIKFLNAYDRMDEVGISGTNIDGTKGSVERMMDTALVAFDKQLDALYSDEALDITTDIKVMEGLLAQDGLTGDDFFKKL